MTTRTAPDDNQAGRSEKSPSAIAAEAIKLWSLPTQRALIVVAVGLAAVTAALFYLTLPVTQGRTLAQLAPGEIFGAGIFGVDAAAFAVIVVAAIHVGSEYSTGAIYTTLTLTPSRWRILAGKLVTVGLTALAVGILAAVVCVLAAVIAGATAGMDAGLLLTGASLRLAAGSVAMPVLYAVLAAAGAFVFRSTALGIVTPLTVLMVGGISGFFGDTVSSVVTPLMPVSAIHSLAGSATGHEGIGLLGAFMSLIAWIGIAAGAAAWRLHGKDA
ncbi:hypothetical protein ITP53_08040 [Nonomuraea sp. K274]|uniref:ABC-2 type transport system permease protein n=1 Tax=Nonomuraea cypriaca TaxID=1187855 RepID=A0A931EVI5_9ACTN|nr:hypothetical protein [Nonomuraea cypriaca]MBF8185689.1 hypothetical protein [Nonomuraea cypriaca]